MWYNFTDNSTDLVSTARRLWKNGKSDEEIIYYLKARSLEAEKLPKSTLQDIIRQAKRL